MLKNEYLIAKFGLDTAENEVRKVRGFEFQTQYKSAICAHSDEQRKASSPLDSKTRTTVLPMRKPPRRSPRVKVFGFRYLERPTAAQLPSTRLPLCHSQVGYKTETSALHRPPQHAQDTERLTTPLAGCVINK